MACHYSTTSSKEDKVRSNQGNINTKDVSLRRIVPATKKTGERRCARSSKEPPKSTKKKKEKPMILQKPIQHAAPGFGGLPRNPIPIPPGNFQRTNIPGPHPMSMHPPPVGTHDSSDRKLRGLIMNMGRVYHDNMNHSGPPPGDMRLMQQHHMPSNGYHQNTNPNPHIMPHSISHGQMSAHPSQGTMGVGPYHYSHPPQPLQNPGQYAPYTTLNQSHTKSKGTNKKNSGFATMMHSPANFKQKTKKGKSTLISNMKRPGGSSDDFTTGKKKTKSNPLKPKKTTLLAKSKSPSHAMNTGGKNSNAAALAAAILRGVTMRPSGKWQAQLYYAGKSRYIGVFDTREKAALAYEIAREKLKSDKSPDVSNQCIQETEAAVSLARKAAFEGVNEPDPRPPHKR